MLASAHKDFSLVWTFALLGNANTKHTWCHTKEPIGNLKEKNMLPHVALGDGKPASIQGILMTKGQFYDMLKT